MPQSYNGGFSANPNVPNSYNSNYPTQYPNDYNNTYPNNPNSGYPYQYPSSFNQQGFTGSQISGGNPSSAGLSNQNSSGILGNNNNTEVSIVGNPNVQGLGNVNGSYGPEYGSGYGYNEGSVGDYGVERVNYSGYSVQQGGSNPYVGYEANVQNGGPTQASINGHRYNGVAQQQQVQNSQSPQQIGMLQRDEQSQIGPIKGCRFYSICYIKVALAGSKRQSIESRAYQPY